MERAKILVVDDESRMRKLVKDFLTREGYTVLEARDGMEAMDLFYEDKEIALIILDVMMPKMDGWEVLKTIRKWMAGRCAVRFERLLKCRSLC